MFFLDNDAFDNSVRVFQFDWFCLDICDLGVKYSEVGFYPNSGGEIYISKNLK